MKDSCCYGSKIEVGYWQGEPSISFNSGGYEAIILPEVGANIISLKNAVLGCDILRTPKDINDFKSMPVVYGIPILFPPNRIENGMFEAEGKVYKFPINEDARNNHIHGFLYSRKWEVSKAEILSDGTAAVEVTFLADSTSDFFRYFPHEFEIKILNKLSSKGLKQEISILNNSNSPMPMCFGFHTVFNAPFHHESKKEDYRLKASIDKLWELNDRMLPTGRLLEPFERYQALRGEGLIPSEFPMDGHFTSQPLKTETADFHGAILRDISKGIDLVYEVGSGFKHWMIWNSDGNKDFICPEPQTCAVNAPNIKLSHDVTGFNVLLPNEKWMDYCRIYLKSE